ncbi:phBC6A51 family helix-turn-helix protein [Opitutaceae bacterium]|nr:phBC6A51 family helix-turn-helix protein [Opitutaceae bacterium]
MDSNDKKEALLTALRNNRGNISKACGATGVSRGTFYNWREIDSDFAERVQHVDDDIVDLAQDKLMEKVEEGNIQAITFVLKTKGRRRGYGKSEEEEDSSGRRLRLNSSTLGLSSSTLGISYSDFGDLE